MRLTDIVKEAEKLKGEDIHTLFLWAVDAEFAPLVLETSLGVDNLVIQFKPVSYRKVVRYLAAQELSKRAHIYSRLYLQIPIKSLFYDLLFDGISLVMLNDIPQCHEFIRQYPTLESLVARTVFIINGIDPVVASEFERQLKLLEDISFAFFAEIAPAPSWAGVLILSYQLFKEGGVWSKPVPIDEPYLLWQAWLAVARGEKRYYDAKFSSSEVKGVKQISAQPSDIPIGTISSLRDAIDLDGLMQALREINEQK